MPQRPIDWSQLPDQDAPNWFTVNAPKSQPARAERGSHDPWFDQFEAGAAPNAPKQSGWFAANAPQPQRQNDPFAAYAVSQPSAPTADPFAEFAVQPEQRSELGRSRKPLTFELIEPARAVSSQPLTFELMEPAQTPEQGSALGRFASGAWEMLNPVEIVKGAVHAVSDIPGTVSGLVEAQRDQFGKAGDAFSSGRYSEAFGHAVAGALPIVGPVAANIGERIGQGDVAGGLGQAAGLVTSIVAPGAIAKRLPTRTRAPFRNPNPVAVEAVQAGLAAGVPIDAATATGNRFVRAAQHASDRSLGGSGVAARAAQQQARGLATMGEQLAAKGFASPMTPELAGQAVQTGVAQAVGRYASEADAAYSALRKIEANPSHARQVPLKNGGSQLVPLPVEIAPSKAVLRPIYQSLLREAQLTPLQGSKGRALVALDRLMQAPEAAPLSAVDGALSDLKAYLRKADGAPLDAGQGAIARVVSELDTQVEAAAHRAGPDALRALREGRKATFEKHAAQDVLEMINREPVKAASRLTQPKDAAIAHLRDVAKYAPAELPKIGRAVLDDLIGQATDGGAFEHAARIASKWEAMGPQTKMLLYRDPVYAKDLNNFFRLVRMTAENANPSGTASTVAAGAQMAAIGATAVTFNPLPALASVVGPYGVSRFLHSQRGVQFLTKGFKIPAANRAAQAAYMSEAAAISNRLGATSPSESQNRATVPAWR